MHSAMPVITTTSRAHIEYYTSYAMTQSSAGISGIAIADSGADTCVIDGLHWQVEHEDTFRKANVVGFDQQTARKFGLPIVQAVTMMQHPDQTWTMIRAPEAIFNKEASMTLLSEYQCRDAGCVIDTVSNNHRHRDGSLGSQSFEPNPDACFTFERFGALMSLRIRKPTMAEYASWKDKAIPVCSEGPWKPSDHFENDAMRSMLCLAQQDDEIEQFLDANEVEDPEEDPPEEVFSDATQSTAAYEETLYIGHEPDEPDLLFFDPDDDDFDCFVATSDDLSTKARLGRIFHLSIDHFAAGHIRTDDSLHRVQTVRESTVDELLDDLSNEELYGHDQTFDSFAFAVNTSRQLFTQADLEDFAPYLCWKPLEVIKKTLENTTQLAKSIWRYPLRAYRKTRWPVLNFRRLTETISMDSLPASVNAFGGYRMGQVFYGTSSKCIDVYGMKKEKEIPKVYMDFMREHGVPQVLRRDGAAVQKSAAMMEINRERHVKDEWSEPHNQQQNPVELNAIRLIKSQLEVLLARCNAPDAAWLDAAQYIANVNNVCAHEGLDWRIPEQVRSGLMQDISAYLHFRFWQPVYYTDTEASFPATKELLGHWVGVASNVGDALCFKIRTVPHNKLIYRSVVRPANDPTSPNHRAPVSDTIDDEETIDDDNEPSTGNPDDPPPPASTRILPPIDTVHAARAQERARNSKQKHRAERRKPKVAFTVHPPIVHHLDAVENTPDMPPHLGSIHESGEASLPDAGELHHSGELRTEENIFDSGEFGREEESKTEEEESPRYPKRNRTSTKHLSFHAKQSKSDKKRFGFVHNLLWQLGLFSVLFVNTSTPVTHMAAQASHYDGTPIEQLVPEHPQSVLNDPDRTRLLLYANACDRHAEAFDDAEDTTWEPRRIMDHRLAKKGRVKRHADADGNTRMEVVTDRHLRLKIEWSDGNRSLIQGAAMRLEHPFLVIKYANEKELTENKDLSWVQEYLKDPDRIIAMAQALKVHQVGPRFKFGVEVARNPKHGINLDKANGNDL